MCGPIALVLSILVMGGSAMGQETWVATWAAAQQLSDAGNAPPPPGLSGSTLRQVVRLSLGGPRLRVRFSNAFGTEAVTIDSAAVALAAGSSAIHTQSQRALTFGGQPRVTIPPGALVISDAVEMAMAPVADLAITTYMAAAPAEITTHPGARCTSYLVAGNHVADERLPDAVKTEHWYLITGVEVPGTGRSAIAAIGDSITDGRGSTTNGNGRWTDFLNQRLQADTATSHLAALNLGIGGNRVLNDGLGPSVLARLDRDVLAQPGVKWLILFEGINDIGTGERNGRGSSSEALVAAYQQIIERCHARGIKVYGATLLPMGGSQYDDPQREAQRQAVNEWIRTSGAFDAVIDLDSALRDPERPNRLISAADCGDHLHLNDHGYRMIAQAIDLDLFR